jgi:predicted nucleotidyltransferase
VLFGSRASGEADARSEYDVLVVEPAVENTAAESTRLRAELNALRVPIDVVVVDEDLARRACRGTRNRRGACFS